MNDERRTHTRAPRPGHPRRKTNHTARKLTVLVGATLLLVIAGVGWTGTTLKVTSSDAPAAPALATDVTVQPLPLPDGTVYVLTIAAMSTATDTEHVTFNSGQTYDFIVKQDGREVWRWSQGRAFHQAIVERTFHPDELHAFTELWDGRDADGNPVIGTVEVHGVMMSVPRLDAAPVTLHLD